MNLILDLLPPAGSLDDETADAMVARAAAALESGETADLPEKAATAIDRMRQAADKIASGERLRRLGELITLAQFGAGSAALLVSDACGDAGAARRCEGCFIGYFLTDVVARAKTHSHLIPAELDRTAGSAPDYEALFQRANDAMQTPGQVSHRGLGRFLARRSATTRRHISRLRRYGPDSPRAAVTAVDRWLVSLSLFLHREAAS